jgi:hypothetical protein
LGGKVAIFGYVRDMNGDIAVLFRYLWFERVGFAWI